MNYSEKLRDPRWQKKRLEVLNRDKFACQKCGDTENTLHVHHRWYEPGCEPWDDENDCGLTTLCEDCHKDEGEKEKHLKLFSDKFKYSTVFFFSDLEEIGEALSQTLPFYPREVMIAAMCHALTDDFVMKTIVEKYFEFQKMIKERHEKRIKESQNALFGEGTIK